MDRYDAYDPFADLYNRRWGGFAVQVVPLLERLVLDDLPDRATVVDLCCGTGQLLAELGGRGLDLIGVDGSPAMIGHATTNAPDAELVVDDARSFRLDRPADAVVSTFDSLNHVMTADGLSAVFRRVADALRPGGVFLFDVNNHEGYLARWQGSFSMVDDDEVVAVSSTYDPDRGEAAIAMTHFAPAPAADTPDRADRGCWHRTDLRFTQRCHPDGEIRDGLSAAGFVDIEHWQADEFDPSDRDPGRSFYRGRKPR